MNIRLIRFGIIAICLAVAALAFSTWAEAQSAGNGSRSAAAASPRMPDGKPDLSGWWGGGGGGDGEGGGEGPKPDEKGNLVQLTRARGCHPGMALCAAAVNQSKDSTFERRYDANRPLYKPEHWDKIQHLDANTNTEDPVLVCQPLGVPRMGPPQKIVQTPKEVIFLYAQGGASTQPQDFRIIPIDGRKHDPIRAQDLTYYGHSVGRWEGDTLVVDSVGFNDITWLKNGGYFHTNNMRVLEKFRREGDTLHYQVVVEDPEVLLEPWVTPSRQIRLNTNPNAFIPEGLPCEERDSEHLVGKIRH
jgi:hypothetical protein